ncbi:MAG: recombinase family protein [Pseudomonadota bacterium]
MRTFGYGRCSTDEQNPQAQLKELKDRGFEIPEGRFFFEIVSGGIPAMQRPQFANLVTNKLEPGDLLVVAKLDRLGRNNIDVQNTVTSLLNNGIKVSCLDIPVQDLTTAEGKLMLQLMASFAEFEKARIRERTMAGLAASTKKAGRPPAIETTNQVQRLKNLGKSQSEVARVMACSVPTVKRHWNKKN